MSRTNGWVFIFIGVFYILPYSSYLIITGPETASFYMSKRWLFINLYNPASVSLYKIGFKVLLVITHISVKTTSFIKTLE